MTPLKTGDSRTVYYVVQPDPRESDLTGCTDADRGNVAKLVPMTYANEPDDMAAKMANLTVVEGKSYFDSEAIAR